ncbi:hypothetical protein Tco_1187392, partial [Tanacetum coccineum]
MPRWIEESTRNEAIHTHLTLKRSTKVSQSRIAMLAIRVRQSNPTASKAHYALTVLFNPWTKEVTKLPMAPLLPAKVSCLLTLSFDYDSYTDDYKVVIAIKKTWYLVQWGTYVFDYHFNAGTTSRKVTLSFNLSWEKFLVFLEPNDKRYDSSFTTLGILEDQLCIFSDDNVLPRDIWVMRSYNVQDSWELLSNDCEIKYEVIQYMNKLDCYSPKKTTTSFFCNHKNKFSSRALKYISAPKFVPSLVSPLYVLTGKPSQPKNLMSIEVWSAE